MPTISVCIPTYNRKDYLKETLESVFRQTYKDYEVIVLDDGSTDGTEEMIKDMEFPVRYCWQENRGDAGAKNAAIKMAKGQYVSLLDSDDLLFDDALARLISKIDGQEDRIAYGPYIRVDENGKYLGCDKRRQYSGQITKELFQNIFVHPNGSLFPRDIFLKGAGFDETLPVCSDYSLFLDLSIKYEFVALSKPTFKHRRHRSNISEYNYRNHMIELKLLEDFYLNKGGKQKMSQELAFKRLAKQAYRAGKCAVNKKNYLHANDILKKSLSYKFSLKAVWMLFKMKFLRLLFREQSV